MRAIPVVPVALSLVVCLLLAGCSAGAPDGDSSADTAALPTGAMDHIYEDVPPANAPPGSVMPRTTTAIADSPARWDGFGEAQFGMDGEQVKIVWPGTLTGAAAAGSSCYHLSPAGGAEPVGLAMMFENGGFVRYSVSAGDLTAPGGGARGMDLAGIEALYPGKAVASGHKYVPGGHSLRIEQDGGGHVLVFETDPAGVVTEWRVGVPPQVDYVEGCS